jgi:PAS domain S-box-containing protein
MKSMSSTVERTSEEDIIKVLVEQAPVGVSIVQDGKFCYVNSYFSTTTGYTADELIGKDSFILIVPEDGEMVRENTSKMLKGEFLTPYQFRVTCKDGSIIWVMATVKSIQYHERKAFLGNYMEITGRKQTEEALQAEKNKLQAVIGAMEYGLTIQDRDYNIIYQNEPSRIAYGGDHVGEKCYRIYASRDKACPKCPVAMAFRDSKSHTVESRKVMPSGEVTFWENTASPIRDAKGEIVSCLEVTRDITERKQAEEARIEAEDEKSAFLEEAPVGIIHTDLKGKITYVNKRFESESGYSREEITGKSGLQLDWFPAGTTKYLVKRIAARLKGSSAKHWETQFKCKDGRWIWIELEGKILRRLRVPVGFQIIASNITERKQAEEALRQSEERYRTILEEMEDAYFEVDLGGHFTFVNNSVCRDLGYSREELMGMSYKKFTVEEDIESVFQVFNEVYQSGVPNKGFPWKTVRKDGVCGFAETSISTLRNDKGEIIGFRGVGRDVTERNQAEEAIKQAAEEWRKTFDSISDSVSIHDRDFRVQRVNKAFVDMCHVKPRQVIGKLCYEVMADMHETIPNCPHQETLRTGKPAKTEFFVVKKGAYIEISTSPIFNKKREVVGTVHITRDITERKRMEEALRQSEENYRALFDGSVTGTFVLDAETRKIMMANQAAAKMFGFSSAEELIGTDTLNNVPAEDKESVSELMAKNLFEQDLQRTHEFRTITKDGREIWISANAARIIHNGKLACLACFTDITEQKQQNERLIMTDRLACIGELASGAAHELNNPLASIIGFSQLLMEKEAPDDIREDLKIINSEAQRAAIVTNNLLAFARKHAPMKQPNQINNIIEDVLELRAREHELNHIDVESHLAPNLPEVLVDYFQMQQVFMNIIINAEYFITKAHNGGSLTITTQKENSTVRISIADDGPGISPEDMGRIFDPFFTTKEAGSGTGLGLSICHGIVNEHGGQIYVRSQLGKGATIFIELPIKNRAHIKSLL